MVKGSEVMQIVFSMKSRVEIMALHVHCCMLELIFLKVLSHTGTVAEDASESALVRFPGRTLGDTVRSGAEEHPGWKTGKI